MSYAFGPPAAFVLALVLAPVSWFVLKHRSAPLLRTGVMLGWTWFWVEWFVFLVIPLQIPTVPLVTRLFENTDATTHARTLALPEDEQAMLSFAWLLSENADTLPADVHHPSMLFLGDSFTAGQGLSEPESFIDRIQQAYTAQGVPLQTIDYSEPGMNFRDEVVLYALAGRSLAADVVVWTLILNDFPRVTLRNDQISPPAALTPTGSALVDFTRKLVQERRDTRDTRAAYRHMIADTHPFYSPAFITQALTPIAQDIKARGGRLVIVIFPLLYDLKAYPFVPEHERLAYLARDAGAEVIDLAPAFAGLDERMLWVHPSDHHPNAKAHQIAADAIFAQLSARPIPQSGPVDCTLPLEADPLIDPLLQEACEHPDADVLVRAAEAYIQPPEPFEAGRACVMCAMRYYGYQIARTRDPKRAAQWRETLFTRARQLTQDAHSPPAH